MSHVAQRLSTLEKCLLHTRFSNLLFVTSYQSPLPQKHRVLLKFKKGGLNVLSSDEFNSFCVRVCVSVRS